MRRVLLGAGVVGLHILAATCVSASDLGTSGPFRSLGGAFCPAGAPPTCEPAPVDPSLSPAAKVSQEIARALALLDFVRIGEARAALDEAIRLDPDNVQALTLRGRLALTDGDLDRAKPDIEHAASLAPGDLNLLATLAAFAEPDQALHDLDSVLLAQPENVDALFARARLRLRCGNLDGALADLNRSLAALPEDARARAMRAQIHLRRGANESAIVDAEKTLALRPRDPQAVMVKAAAQAALDDPTGAIETYGELLAGHPGRGFISPEAHKALIERGRLLARLRRFDEARKDFDTLLEQRGIQAVLQLQLFLRGHGYPNVEISGQHTTAFDTALNACFSDTICGPNLFR